MKNQNWITPASAATWAVFLVLCLFAIQNARLGTLRSQQGIQLSQLGPTSIAPENLPRAGDLFRASLRVQDPEFPVENMTRLPAWNTLQSTLSAYAERLKLVEANSRDMDRVLQQRSWWTAWGALAFILANLVLTLLRRQKTDTRTQSETGARL